MSLRRQFRKTLLRLKERAKRSFVSGQTLVQESSVPTAWVTSSTASLMMERPAPGVSVDYNMKPAADSRIEKKPVEVYKEILDEEPKMNLIELDQQIRVIKRRSALLREDLGINATDEKIAIEYLQARKKYLKFQQYFPWAVATYSKIDALCSKYKLRMVSIVSYYKSCPLEATEELEKYLDAYERVRKDKPQVNLIVDDGGIETKKDPILLGSSPFGRWWYILGAWDKEVEYVDAIVYHCK